MPVTSAPRLTTLLCALALSGLVAASGGVAVAEPGPAAEPAQRTIPTSTSTFLGSGNVSIPDASNAGNCGAQATVRDITFAVSGMPASLVDVSLSLTVAHSYMGDLSIYLIAPNGANAPVAVRPGATQTTGTTPAACGYIANYNGTYNFNDRAAGTVWTAPSPFSGSTDGSNLPGGDFRTSGPFSAAATSLTAPFTGLASPNGTWTLRIVDVSNQNNNTGSGSAGNASLTLVAQDRTQCNAATAALVTARQAAAVAEAAMVKAKKKLKKAKKRGASAEKIAKALKKSRKAKKAAAQADAAAAAALQGYYSVC